MAGAGIVRGRSGSRDAVEGKDRVGAANDLHAGYDRSGKEDAEKLRLTLCSHRHEKFPETAGAVEIFDARRVGDAHVEEDSAEAASGRGFGGEICRTGQDKAQADAVVVEHGKSPDGAERWK